MTADTGSSRELRDVNETATEDVRAIVVALGLGGHARPYSAHDVVRREILPEVAALIGLRDEIARLTAIGEARGIPVVGVADLRAALDAPASPGDVR